MQGNKFLADAKETYDKYGRCVIVVLEGIQDEKGVAIATKLVRQGDRYPVSLS